MRWQHHSGSRTECMVSSKRNRYQIEYFMGRRSIHGKEIRGIGVTVRHVETMQAHFGPGELRPFPILAPEEYVFEGTIAARNGEALNEFAGGAHGTGSDPASGILSKLL